MLKEDASPSKSTWSKEGRQKQNRWRPPQEIHSLLTELDLLSGAVLLARKHHLEVPVHIEYKQYVANLLTNVPSTKGMYCMWDMMTPGRH